MSELFTDLVIDLETDVLNDSSHFEEKNGLNLYSKRIKTNGNIISKTLNNANYYTIPNITKGNGNTLIYSVQNILLKYLKDKNRILVVGFGNNEYVVDKLGIETLKYIGTNRHNVDVVTIAPLVESVTGISSLEIVASIVGTFEPDIILAIDTLATSNIDRLGTCIQITDAGISPGGGVGGNSYQINSETFGVPIVSIGVPLVISSLVLDNKSKRVYLSPSNIDNIIDMYAKIFGKGIDKAIRSI